MSIQRPPRKHLPSPHILYARKTVSDDEALEVINYASRIVEVLAGEKSLNVTVEEAGHNTYSSAPSEVPSLMWGPGWQNPQNPAGATHSGDLGEFVGTELMRDERPSMLVNAGFYAGILAVKLGLVDPEQFQPDDLHASRH